MKSSLVRVESPLPAHTPVLSAAPSSSPICCFHRRSAAVVLTPPVVLVTDLLPLSSLHPSSSSPICYLIFADSRWRGGVIVFLANSRCLILVVSSPFSHLPCLVFPDSSPLLSPCRHPPSAAQFPFVSQLRIPPTYRRSLSPLPSPLPASSLPTSPFLLYLNLRHPLHAALPPLPLSAALPPLQPAALQLQSPYFI
ncbi:hypothetical protein ACLOJK_017029 [Asimina triloba]